MSAIQSISDKATLRMRIAERVAIDEKGCWNWQGHLVAGGYGVIRVGGRRATSAHRAAYMANIGDVPDGCDVDHVCFNASCVNPDHLRALDAVENRRRQRKALSPTCKRGHEFTPENTIWQQDRHYPEANRAHRLCRACRSGSAS
jgi:hypothetical protein